MKEALYLCGAGNPEGVRLALLINKSHRKWERIYVLDDNPEKHGKKVMGVPVAGPFDLLADVDSKTAEIANLVARTTAKRWAVHKRLQSFEIPFTSLISPGTCMMGVEVIGDITSYLNAVLSAECSIGSASVVFTNAVVGHGARLQECCVVAPGAVINARVDIGKGVYIGTNASILPDVKIGDWATIGACSSVIEDVPVGATVMGVPGQIFMLRQDDVEPAAESSTPAASVDHIQPRTFAEETLLRIWQDELGLDSVGVTESIFDLGANSLIALRVASRIEHTFNLRIPLQLFFSFPAIADIAGKVEDLIIEQTDDATLERLLNYIEMEN